VSRMCRVGYLELGLFVRIACMCSLYRVRKFLPVCPVFEFAIFVVLYAAHVAYVFGVILLL
jgi:hypothetical protein